jgi:hypothetical protein
MSHRLRRDLLLPLVSVLVVAGIVGCDGNGSDPWDAFLEVRDALSDDVRDAFPVEVLDAPADPGDDASEPPQEWVEPHGEEVPSGSVITPDAGGTVVSDDGRVRVSFPPGAVAVPTTVTLGPLNVPGPLDTSDLGLSIDVDARDPGGQMVTQLAGHAYLYFRHAGLAFVPRDTESMVVHAHAVGEADDEGTWTPLATAQSPDGGTAMARTGHFSGFGLYTGALTGNLNCKSGGSCRTSISESNPISSMGMDGQGNLYFIHPNGPYIYRIPSGGGPTDVEIFFNAQEAYSGTWLYKNYITVSDRTGDVFLVRNEQVFRIAPDKSWSLLYPTGSDTGVKVQAARIDPNDGTLWVQCRDDFTQDSLRQISASGTVTATVPFNATRGLSSQDNGWGFDSDGRLFALRGWSLYVLDDPVGNPGEPWQLVAEGFPGTRRAITADQDGNVFVASGMALCPGGSTCILDPATRSHQIAVVNGTPAFPNLRIGGLRNPTMVVRSGNRLLVSGGDSIITLPLDRRDPVDANAGEVSSPSLGSLSGRGSFVKLVGRLASSPVHHAVWMGGIRLPLAQVLPGELRFTIPSYDHMWEWAKDQLPNLGQGARMTLPSGDVAIRVGPATRSIGAIQTPEPGRYKPTSYSQSRGSGTCLPAPQGLQQPPLQVAIGEWVYWRHGSVSSRDGLFPALSAAEDGPWMAYRFTQAGDYVFDWVTEEGTLPCSIRVSPGGAADYVSDFLVDPGVGGTFYNNGARMVIPGGALPGNDTYQLRLTTIGVPAPASDVPAPDDPPDRSRQFYRFDPDPPRLGADLRFGVPLGGDSEQLAPAFFDDGAAAGVPATYRQSMYIPIAHEIDGAAGYVNVVLDAGDYGAEAPAEPASGIRRIRRPVSPSLGGAVSWLGHKIKAGVNEVGGYLWWKVRMPNSKIEDSHFTILYNTREGMTEQKALAAHEGLTMARTRFMTEGYIVPDWTIVTLDPKLATEGSTSGLGRLAHWNMTLGAWQVDDDLRSSAAHELFHIIQYENMSYDARARKFQWKWWMEGTAVWAEERLFPGQNSAADWVKKGSDFIHKGIRNYGSMTDAQAYSSAALILHLEKENEGIVLEILQSLGLMTSPEDALRDKVGNIPKLVEEFAISYFGGVDAPYKSWDLSKAFLAPRTLANPATPLIDKAMPGESAVAVRVATDPTKTPPVSFNDASGSVVRATHQAILQTTLILDPKAETVGALIGTLVGTPQARGLVLDKASTFTPANALTVIHVNGDPDGTVRNPNVVFEVPTVESVTPATFPYQSGVDLTLSGGGFGPSELGTDVRRVLVFFEERDAMTWAPETIVVRLPPNTVTPMDVPIQVRNAAGVVSNTVTIKATN